LGGDGRRRCNGATATRTSSEQKARSEPTTIIFYAAADIIQRALMGSSAAFALTANMSDTALTIRNLA
jgi:hypothetical protein